jgi:PAS domain S-box-containing protein
MNLKGLWQRITPQNFSFDDPLQQRRSQFYDSFLALSLILLAVTTLVNLFQLFFAPEPNIVRYLIEDFLMGIVLLGLFFMNRRGLVQISAIVFIGLSLISIPIMMPPEWRSLTLLLYIIPIQASSFILRPFASLPTTIVSVICYLFFQTLQPEIDLGNVVLFLGILVILALAAWFVADRLEKALKQSRQSELRYINLLEKNPFCIYMTAGGQAGRWLYISPRIHDLLGVTPQDWLSNAHQWSQMIHPADLPVVFDEIERCQETHTPFQAEYRMINSAGQVVWVSDNAVAVATPGQPDGVQGVLLDITARKRAEQVQAAIYDISQAAFAADDLNDLYFIIHGVLGELMHAENFFIALYDPDTDMLNFPYFVDQYDLPPEPVIARHGLTEYVLRTGKAVLATAQECARLVALGEISDVGTPSVDWLGVPLWVNNRVIGVMTVQSYSEKIRFSQAELDILNFVSIQVAMVIERKRNDTALREINQLTSEVISGVNTGIIVYDQAARHLIWNQYMEQMTGLPKEEVLGQPANAVSKYADFNRLEGVLDQAMTGAIRVIPDMEYSVPHTGKSGWLAGYCGPHRDAQGEIIGVIAVIYDITARKQTEEALRTAVSEKEVMMREIHHRVKNNLQVMSSLISLQADTVSDAVVQGHFREMQMRVRSMALVHEELYQSQDFSRVNIAAYLEKLTSGLMNSYAINPHVEMKVDVASIFLAVDVAIPCGLIINELVSNAFKHAFPNERTGEVAVSVQELPDGVIRMQVRDNGVGLPAGIDIYNTETLGMQLITILTRQLRGNLQVEWGGGTCFQIEFREPHTLSR